MTAALKAIVAVSAMQTTRSVYVINVDVRSGKLKHYFSFFAAGSVVTAGSEPLRLSNRRGRPEGEFAASPPVRQPIGDGGALI